MTLSKPSRETSFRAIAPWQGLSDGERRVLGKAEAPAGVATGDGKWEGPSCRLRRSQHDGCSYCLSYGMGPGVTTRMSF